MNFLPVLNAQSEVIPNRKRCISGEERDLYRSLHPELLQNKAFWSSLKTDSVPQDTGLEYGIPIVVHVMHDYGPELNISMSMVEDQLRVLNEDFSRSGNGYNDHPDGADTRIRFCLATRAPDGSPTNGLNYVHYPPTVNVNPYNIAEDTLMKSTIQWDPTRYLNIYVVRLIASGQLYGYAFYPDEVAGSIYDGVTVDYRSFGIQGGGVYGRTVTHEVGHYLGLIHTWGDGDCTVDDEVEDTPLCANPFFSAPPACQGVYQCANYRMTENYMDYSMDQCMNTFTKGQAQRMRKSIALYRPQLVERNNLYFTRCEAVMDSLPVSGEFYVYPSPAFEQFLVYIDFDLEEEADLYIVDPRGRKVYARHFPTLTKGVEAIDFHPQMKGLYHVVFRSESREEKRSVMVLK